MGDEAELSPSKAKTAADKLLEKLSPAARVTLERDIADAARRYRPGDVVRLIFDLPAGPRPGDPVET